MYTRIVKFKCPIITIKEKNLFDFNFKLLVIATFNASEKKN
jgi:hypothetical protein